MSARNLGGRHRRQSANSQHRDVVFLPEGLGRIGQIKRRLVAEVTHAIKSEQLTRRLSRFDHAIGH